MFRALILIYQKINDIYVSENKKLKNKKIKNSLFCYFPNKNIYYRNYNFNNSIIKPNNTIIKPNNSIIKANNSIIKPNNSIIKPNNSIIKPNNSIIKPNNSIINSNINKNNNFYGHLFNKVPEIKQNIIKNEIINKQKYNDLISQIIY
jgi:hypothetical protein